MYDAGKKGVLPAVTGGLGLPNTGGNTFMTVIALTAIATGVAILLTTIVRYAVKRSVKA